MRSLGCASVDNFFVSVLNHLPFDCLHSTKDEMDPSCAAELKIRQTLAISLKIALSSALRRLAAQMEAEIHFQTKKRLVCRSHIEGLDVFLGHSATEAARTNQSFISPKMFSQLVSLLQRSFRMRGKSFEVKKEDFEEISDTHWTSPLSLPPLKREFCETMAAQAERSGLLDILTAFHLLMGDAFFRVPLGTFLKKFLLFGTRSRFGKDPSSQKWADLQNRRFFDEIESMAEQKDLGRKILTGIFNGNGNGSFEADLLKHILGPDDSIW